MDTAPLDCPSSTDSNISLNSTSNGEQASSPLYWWGLTLHSTAPWWSSLYLSRHTHCLPRAENCIQIQKIYCIIQLVGRVYNVFLYIMLENVRPSNKASRYIWQQFNYFVSKSKVVSLFLTVWLCNGNNLHKSFRVAHILATPRVVLLLITAIFLPSTEDKADTAPKWCHFAEWIWYQGKYDESLCWRETRASLRNSESHGL